MNSQIIMGGAQSTGSSLLVNILNRHSAISAGEETYLFMHPRLYTHWNHYKKYLLRTNKFSGLKSQGWFLMNGAKLLNEDYGWEEKELENLIEDAINLPVFASNYMAKRVMRTSALLWVEKSPANVMTFSLFLKTFPFPKVIHTARDPYDVVASLVARGYSPYYAAGAYIVHSALALRSQDHPEYHLIKYEDLVLRPRQVVGGLLAFMDLPWEDGILEPRPKEREEEVKLKGWLQNEKARIGLKSLGRFNCLSEIEQTEIINALALFRINPAFAKRHALHFTNLRGIAETLGYPYLEASKAGSKKLIRQLWNDKWSRTFRFYPGFGIGYPGGIDH